MTDLRKPGRQFFAVEARLDEAMMRLMRANDAPAAGFSRLGLAARPR